MREEIWRWFFNRDEEYEGKQKYYLFSDRSAIKQKTFDPVWNETFIHEVENASTLGITVFHKAPIDDVFNANATISFEDLIARNQQEQTDFWVDLEPCGRLHVKIDLRWSQGKNCYFFQHFMVMMFNKMIF